MFKIGLTLLQVGRVHQAGRKYHMLSGQTRSAVPAMPPATVKALTAVELFDILASQVLIQSVSFTQQAILKNA